MAHRIYIYNVNPKTKETFEGHLAEWNYEIPALMLPLFSSGIRARGTQLYANKEEGIARLRYFYTLLADVYQLHYKNKYTEPVNKMFEFLESLPFDTFQIDGRDVFNMNEEKHAEQASDWVDEIRSTGALYTQAFEQQNLDPLQEILRLSGYNTFLEILETDWINYGLGLWEEHAFKKEQTEAFEENGKQGLKDSFGNILVAAKYDEIFEFNEAGIAVVELDNRFGYINERGEEIVPCQYVDAFDAQVIDGVNYAEVEIEGKRGVLHIASKQLSLPAVYDELDWFAHGFLNAKRGDSYFLFAADGTLIVTEPAADPFAYDYRKLFYNRQKGTMKRKYFHMDGRYFGSFLEDSLQALTYGYFWIKPNKLQRKISIIKPDGTVLDEEIDRIIGLDDYRSLAYLKDKKWQIYSLAHDLFRLVDRSIDKILVDSIKNFRKDVFVVACAEGQGIYEAYLDQWLLEPDASYLKIEYCYMDFMRIHESEGMRYFDTKVNFYSELYDYVSAPIHDPHPERSEGEFLLLFKGERLFYVDQKRNIAEFPETAFGRLYSEKYNLQGTDQSYFVQFYQAWTKRKGAGFESYLDNETLYEKARKLNWAGKIAEAIPLLTVGASRGSADCQYLLGNIHSDTDLPDYLDIPKAIGFYEQAVKQDHAQAWTNLGFIYATGLGLPPDIPKALAAYQKAAALGEGQAMSNLGNWYYEGEHLEQDYGQALHYFKQAEKKGIDNDVQIAEIYYQQKDYANLLRYLKKDNAGQYAAIYYGILYEEGWGVKPSMVKALRYYEQANENATYAYAVNRLLYYYKNGTFADAAKYNFWLDFAKNNDVDIEE
ncbi:SEL1-like repeat protein [Sphingobacterium sp.]|uniref:SEL1-like repeat protein n=1 Tax=Sphingobacterium sp. TaxID=341027 RepID=UPI0031D68985